MLHSLSPEFLVVVRLRFVLSDQQLRGVVLVNKLKRFALMNLVALLTLSAFYVEAKAVEDSVRSFESDISLFKGVRTLALELKPESFGEKCGDSSRVIAVLMETGYPEGVATFIATMDGSASLYYETGGGIVGASEEELVARLAIEYVNFSYDYSKEAELTKEFPLPEKKRVRFYFVTCNGVRTLESSESDLGYNKHAFSQLFHKAHSVIAAAIKVDKAKKSKEESK